MNPVWGMLSKSAVDDETIEEAIDRLILAHNENEDSHLEAGQSLQSHKASEIIDHLASSIVADKITAVQKNFVCNFESLDSFIFSATGVTPSYPGVVLQTSTTINTYKECHSDGWFNNFYDLTKNLLFQVSAYFNSFDYVEAFFGWGWPLGGAMSWYCGFAIHDGGLYAYKKQGTTIVETLITTDCPTDVNVYRFVVDSANLTIHFYINNVEACTIVWTGVPETQTASLWLSIENLAASNKMLKIGQLLMARD